MDQRDQDLLDKQTRGIIAPPRHDGVMALGIAAVFVAGMTFGGYLFADQSRPAHPPTHVAVNDVATSLSGVPPSAE